jgi:hypothetical protein
MAHVLKVAKNVVLINAEKIGEPEKSLYLRHNCPIQVIVLIEKN